MALPYQLTKQFKEGTEKLTASFSDEKDALEFMDAKIAWDHKTKVATIYRLYFHSDVIKEINAIEYETVHSAHFQEEKSSITPFGTSPKPGGFPTTKKREDIDDEDEQ
ncbi:MAG: hypothetical protein SFW07_08025 [Gammaproteobacteria bacterium]|nr:hypothetical protein [Gammaproteobacteria bacterium]